jgi:hypothetical protein
VGFLGSVTDDRTPSGSRKSPSTPASSTGAGAAGGSISNGGRMNETEHPDELLPEPFDDEVYGINIFLSFFLVISYLSL